MLSSVFQIFSIRNEKAKMKAVIKKVGVQNCQNGGKTRRSDKKLAGSVADNSLGGSELTKH